MSLDRSCSRSTTCRCRATRAIRPCRTGRRRRRTGSWFDGAARRARARIGVARGLRAPAVLRDALHVLRLQHRDHAQSRAQRAVRRYRARRARSSISRSVPALRDAPVSQIHLGGGTPTFMPPDVLAALLDGLAARLPLRADGYEGSVEVDPRVTTRAHLEALRAPRLLAHLARRAGLRSRSAAPGQPSAAARDHRGAVRDARASRATTRSTST